MDKTKMGFGGVETQLREQAFSQCAEVLTADKVDPELISKAREILLDMSFTDRVSALSNAQSPRVLAYYLLGLTLKPENQATVETTEAPAAIESAEILPVQPEG